MVEERGWYATGFRWLPKRRINKVAVVTAFCESLVGNALLTLSGDLSPIAKALVPRLGTIWYAPSGLWDPHYSSLPWRRVSLLLEVDTIDEITQRILPRAGIVNRVAHVVISKDGIEQVGAFDNFHPDCLVAGPQMEHILTDLTSRGILESFTPIAEDERFWHSLVTNAAYTGREVPWSRSMENTP